MEEQVEEEIWPTRKFWSGAPSVIKIVGARCRVKEAPTICIVPGPQILHFNH